MSALAFSSLSFQLSLVARDAQLVLQSNADADAPNSWFHNSLGTRQGTRASLPNVPAAETRTMCAISGHYLSMWVISWSPPKRATTAIRIPGGLRNGHTTRNAVANHRLLVSNSYSITHTCSSVLLLFWRCAKFTMPFFWIFSFWCV
ncbi:hypothetical protein F5I97DRAFT_817668 [Phlebopus sp. FC_14]|nr:hypothetical protein F5I97DRAFT_817668 [Phlebopus sp. FC_14]